MKKQLLLSFAMCMVALTGYAQTDISGSVSNNTTLTTANSPYTVTGDLTVDAGVTLTVESGVELRFNSGVYLRVNGTMNATGATFTANEGSSGGSWEGIYLSHQNSSDQATVTLDNCIVEYAQSVYVRNGDLTLGNNTLISDFSSYGLEIFTRGTVDIAQTSIQNCSYPVYFRSDNGNGYWTIGDNVDLTGNDNDMVYIDFRNVNSEFNLPDPGIPYYYDSEFRVTETGTLTIDPGVSLLGNTNAYISVYGKFKSNGTETDSVILGKEASAGYWEGINFHDNAIDSACILEYTRITGATYSYYRYYELQHSAVEVNHSSPTFNHCELSGNRYNLVITGRSMPEFNNSSFLESVENGGGTYNMNLDLNAEPTFTNCSTAYNNSEARAIGIIPNTVIDDVQMASHSFTNVDSISYTLYGEVTVHDTASLTVDPGVVIKCTDDNDRIRANGTLNGSGTADQPIVFTHINDDEYGNPRDTRNDGTTSISNSSAGRILLNSTGTSTLDHWIIRYAGYSSSYYPVTVYNGNVVQNTQIKYSHRGILFSDDAQLLNNSLENISDYPFARRMNDGSPVMIGNTIANSGHLGILVHDFLEGSYSIDGLDIGSNTNVAYIIRNNTSIPSGADVTILPGTIFKFANYYGKLSVRGGLKAEGTATNRIIFTSMYDNSAAGNTNFNNGNDPTGYKWDGIEFYNSSNDSFNSLKNMEVRYVDESIRMTDCRVVIDSILLNFSNSHALGIYGNANPEITNSQFNNLSGSPVHMDLFADPTFSGNTIANVSRIGITVNGGTISGTVPARSFAGYDTITYLITETMRVDDELTIPAGLTFKGHGYDYFNIYGTLNVEGTAGNPVVFTALQDDAHGNPGDTEMNGQTSVQDDGNRIVFRDLADDNSVINHALFRYTTDYGIYMDNVSPTIKNTTFYRVETSGLNMIGSSAPTVDSCVFEDVPYPILTSLMTFPGSHQGNEFRGSTARGIFIRDNETLTQNYTLEQQSFAGIENIPYIFDRYTVGTSAVLTIAPGVVLKFRDNGYLNVRNGLIADGGSTSDSAVVFTADRDDFYGGDTYNDGDANQPDRRHWRGIYFPSESIDASCLVNNAIFKHASRAYSTNPNSNNRGAVTIDNASPTIQNSLFEYNYHGIIVRNTSLPSITNCDFVDVNPDYGRAVWNETGTVTVVAENCWWNDASGPYNASSNPGGEGERVSDNVDFDPWISQTAKPIMGDVSLNGEIMPYDASLVLQHTVANITLDAKQLDVADVSGDATVSGFDASLILQYTIGLITNFDQSSKKSLTTGVTTEVTAPEMMETGGEEPFEVPLSLTTAPGVTAVDLRLDVDPDQLRFRGINSEALPPDLMVASGMDAETGILRISLASARDLDLNQAELGLTFSWSDPDAGQSTLSLSGLVANEKEIDAAPLAVQLVNGTNATGIPGAPGLNALQVFGAQERIVARMELAEAQSQLVVTVHDMTGRMTNNLVIEHPGTGAHRFTFEAEAAGSSDSRFYLVTIRGDHFTESRKIVVR